MIQPEINTAAVLLLGFLAALFAYDWTARRKSRRLLYFQLAVFLVGGALIVFPEIARRLAHLVGIGRGVDFVIYPVVIWLVRESLLTRRRRHDEEERLTELVRAIAVERAVDVSGAQGTGRAS